MVNEKVIKFALQQKFSADDADCLYNLAMATPNPAVAFELLLNIYERPVIERHPSPRFLYRKEYKGAKYLHYNPYTDQVTFMGVRDNDLKQWMGPDGSIVSLVDYLNEADMLKSLVRDGDIEMESHFSDHFTLIDEVSVEDTCSLEEWGM